MDKDAPISLEQAQRRLRSGIVLREGDSSTEALHLIEDSGKLSATERLAIYQNAYFARLCESLEDDFKRVRRIVGEAAFAKLARAYLSRFPSRSFTLADLGSDFPGFLATPAVAGNVSFLCDLARLEWTAVQVFYAENLPPLASGKTLPAGDWDKAVFRFDPSVQLLEVAWPVHELWEDQDRKGTAERVRGWKKGAHFLLFFRERFTVRMQKTDPISFHVLKSLLEGVSLGAACAAAQDALVGKPTSEDLAKCLQKSFHDWATFGLIRSVD